MHMVCVIGSTKMLGCIEGVRQTLVGSPARESVIALLESQTGSVSEQRSSLPSLSQAFQGQQHCWHTCVWW